MAEAAAAEAPKGPSLEQLVGDLAGQVGGLTRTVQQQASTLEQLARGTAAVAQRATAQPAPDAATLDRANEEYLKTLATKPLELRRTENQALANELLTIVRQEIAANVSEAEKRRRAEEMERGIYQQNPDLATEGPYIEYYLNHLNTNQATATWQIGDKIAQAVAWARENKAEREKQIVAEYERAKREQARASTPGGASFREPGTAEVETAESQEEANKKRFELLQGRQAAAMGGGRYIRK